MSNEIAYDEELIRRLPLPLAQLYRHAHNAKSLLDLHQASYFLWEAALKLLGSVAVVVYAERASHDPRLCQRLCNLARPAIGHWWEFVRLLTPVLAESGDAGFLTVRAALLGKARDDLPYAAGLHAALREVLDGHTGSRSTVRLSDLFDQLVRYRNKEIGHGALGRRSGDFYHRLGQSLLRGVSELVGRLDFLAGRRLVYVAEVRRQSSGDWRMERYELTGETSRRLTTGTAAEAEVGRLPRPERLYLETDGGEAAAAARIALHPLLIYDTDSEKALFLNARRGRQRTEYLCYTTGQAVEREQLFGEQRALLAQVLSLAEVVEKQAAEWAALSRQEEEPPPEVSEPVTRQIGEFELLSELGRGGMGVVYRARQPSLDREVALKCQLRSGKKETDARFAREIRTLGRVQHPHLVNIFTSGADGDQWFYAMELVEGATLLAVCEQVKKRKGNASEVAPQTWQEGLSTACEETRRGEKPLSEDEKSPPRMAMEPAAPAVVDGYVPRVVELMRQAAEAAHALHEAGVIHRDIKPGNVMVSADGTRAVLLDLGLAQLADALEGKLTRTRQFVGTLRYASPEQVLAVDRLDRRSDVYSLGTTLWELLTLRPLYGATEETPTPEVMKRIQYAEPELPRKHHPGIARDLEAIVMKCLEKDAGRRYGTAKELAEDLGRWQRGEPVRARRMSWGHRFGRFLRRHRRSLAIGASLLLLQIAVVLAFRFVFISPSSNQEIVVPPGGSNSGSQLIEDMVNKGNGSEAPKEGLVSDPTPDDGATVGSKNHQEALKKIDQLRSDALRLRNDGKAIDAIPIAEQLVAASRQEYGEYHEEVANALDFLALIFLSAEKYTEARMIVLKAQKIRKSWLSDTHKHELTLHAVSITENLEHRQREQFIKAELLWQRVEVLYRTGQYHEAVGMAEKATFFIKEVLGDKHPIFVTSLDYLAMLNYSIHDYAKAESLYRQALAIREATGGNANPEIATSLNNLADLYKERGEYAKAEPLYRQALVIREGVLSKEHPSNVITSLNKLAGLYYSMGDYTKAEPLYQKALEITKGALGEKHPDYATSLTNLAANLNAQGKYADAEVLYLQALAIREQALGKEHPSCASSLNSLAGLSLRRANFKQASEFFRKAFGIWKTLEDRTWVRRARAQNLSVLASSSKDRPDVNVRLEMLKLHDRNDTKGEVLGGDGRDPVLKHGDWVAWRVTNLGRETVDVTLLLIDSNYGIEAAFPRPGMAALNRVKPRDHLLRVGRINASKTNGSERMVVIAVRAEGENVDFTWLMFPNLEDAKTRGSVAKFNSPLGKLCQAALYGRVEIAEFSSMDLNTFTLKQISWRTVPRDEENAPPQKDE